MSIFLDTINPIEVYVFITLLHGVFFLDKKNQKHIVLLYIMLINFSTELLSIAMIVINKSKHISIIYSASFTIHQLLWLFLICKLLNLKKSKYAIISIFLLFSIVNLIFIEGSNLNFLTFIFGALLYIILFIYESYSQLKKEKLSFFVSNNYLLLFAPILFFFGFSFIFGFRNSSIRDTIIFERINLYSFISYFVNMVYYSLINLYIYKEQKLNNINVHI